MGDSARHQRNRSITLPPLVKHLLRLLLKRLPPPPPPPPRVLLCCFGTVLWVFFCCHYAVSLPLCLCVFVLVCAGALM